LAPRLPLSKKYKKERKNLYLTNLKSEKAC